MTNRFVALLAASSCLLGMAACSRNPNYHGKVHIPSMQELFPSRAAPQGQVTTQTSVVTRTTTTRAPAPAVPAVPVPLVAPPASAAKAAVPKAVAPPPPPAPAPRTQKPRTHPARRHAQHHVAHARRAVPVAPVSAGGCRNGMVWRKLGGAPYARSYAAAMSPAKVNEMLGAMVACAGMPQDIADQFRAVIRQYPHGTTERTAGQGTPDRDGRPIFIVPGQRLALMMSGGAHPHATVNVTVGDIHVGRGVSKALQAYVWSLYDRRTGTEWIIELPFICYNWSLVIQRAEAPPPPPPPPPPTQASCYYEHVVVVGKNTDAENHFGLFGQNVDLRNSCFRYRILGRDGVTVIQDWHSYYSCVDTSNCSYQTIEDQVNGMPLRFRGNVRVPPACRDGCIIEKSVSAAFATSRNSMIVECLRRSNGQDSCGVMVRQDDYLEDHGRMVAKVFYGIRWVPQDWWHRKLYWRFEEDPQQCRFRDPLDPRNRR